MSLTIGIATSGRREQLVLMLKELAKQIQPPLQVVICPADQNDYDESVAGQLPFPVKVVYGGKGLTRQRNAILKACINEDILVFFDDDYYPSAHFLAEAAQLMQDESIVLARGRLLMDGIHDMGVKHEIAVSLIENQPPLPAAETAISDIYGAYGCNMLIRMQPVRQHHLKFDENLPLYGWQEDIDFSRLIAPYGRIVISSRLTGVHLGTKSGRTSGFKFGYSQIANPLYLYGKGTMKLSYALRLISKNVLANVFRTLQPEPWVDRKGRLRGNLTAFADLLTYRLNPNRINDFR